MLCFQILVYVVFQVLYLGKQCYLVKCNVGWGEIFCWIVIFSVRVDILVVVYKMRQVLVKCIMWVDIVLIFLVKVFVELNM